MDDSARYRTNIGERVGDARVGYRWVAEIWRSEDIGSWTDGAWFKGSFAAQCARLGQKRRLLTRKAEGFRND